MYRALEQAWRSRPARGRGLATQFLIIDAIIGFPKPCLRMLWGEHQPKMPTRYNMSKVQQQQAAPK